MTGNNKVWRAPVAGLASVAMLATMGVATANAATVNTKPSADITVTVDDSATGSTNITVPLGSNYADVLALASKDQLSTSSNNFGGWYMNNQPVDMNAIATNGAKLTIKRQEAGIQVHFVTDDDTNKLLGYVRVPLVDGAFSVPSEFAPYDKADDNLILASTGLTWQAGNGTGNTSAKTEFTYGETISPAAGVTDVTIYVPTTPAYTVKFGAAKIDAGSDPTPETDYKVVYAGAEADGVKDNVLSVEIPNTTNKLDPATVDAKLSLNLKQNQAYAVDSWKVTSDSGSSYSDFTADTTLAAGNIIRPVVKKAFTVKFVDGDSEYAKQAVVNGRLATEPAAPSHDDKTFVGWSETKQTTTTVEKLWNFSANKVTKDTTLYAQYANGGSHTLTYKFNDGQTADKVETYRAKQNTARPADPTRDGYLFAGWYEDTNSNGTIDGLDEEFKFGGMLTADTTLIARWLKANDDTLVAAFAYVNGSDESKNPEISGTKVFTDSSFAEYVKLYQAIQKEYAQAQDEATAAGTQIPAETLSKLVNELTAAWQKLVFTHTGSSQTGNAVVHRLRKGSDHFYTQSLREVTYMVMFQGWTDEGRLFQTAVRDDTGDVYASLENFHAAAVAASSGDTEAIEAIEATLDSIADPILTKVTRLYNRANGDHVWSTDENEVSVLSAQANWNNEGGAFYVPTYTGGQAVTRLYKGNRHLLSTDSNEVKVLAKQGWTDEGVAFLAY